MKTIEPCKISGKLEAPASKSMMQRAIAIAALAKGTSVLHGYTPSNDSDAALKIAEGLGAEVLVNAGTVTIKGGLNPKTQDLHVGESGLGIRMFTPIAALCSQKMALNGGGSLKVRPIDMIEKPLQDLGVTVQTNNGFVPISVQGPINGGTANVDGSLSSQILTGLLIAAPLAKNNTTYKVHDLKSKPYIDMTLQIMNDFKVSAINNSYKTFEIPCKQQYVAQEYNVEGDWSGAAFLLVAAALGGELTVANLRADSKQADVAILTAIASAGAIVEVQKDSIFVKKQALNSFKFDATECPDLFPPLVVLAAHCKGVTEIKGVSRLKHKESDRATVLKNEFAKLGVEIENQGDTMFVRGGAVKSGRIHANNDHRIAMAGACIAILAQGKVEVENPECVAKSYPSFFEDFHKIVSI